MVLANEERWGFNHVFSFKAKAWKMDAIRLAPPYDPLVFDSLKSKTKSTEVRRAPHIVLTNILHSTHLTFLEGVI